ncbi:MAG: PH domain-containing protein [Candidatus Saccharimonadales bacterium]
MARKSFQESSYFKTIETIGPDEHVMCVVYQHPFGIIFIYAATLVCLTLGLIGISVLFPEVAGTSSGTYTVMAFFAVLIAVLVGILLVMATVVYRQTRLTVTDRNIVLIVQKGLLIRKVSQLSLANVEDVTSEQRGFFSNAFNFGTINIETAGEQANFNFAFCPNPHRVAKIILEAKDDFLSRTGQAGSYRNRPYSNRKD